MKKIWDVQQWMSEVLSDFTCSDSVLFSHYCYTPKEDWHHLSPWRNPVLYKLHIWSLEKHLPVFSSPVWLIFTLRFLFLADVGLGDSWDAFFLTMLVKSDYLTYYSLSVNSHKFKQVLLWPHSSARCFHSERYQLMDFFVLFLFFAPFCKCKLLWETV